MKLDRKQFLASFDIVSRGVPQRTPKDVLKNVLFVSDGKTISLSATDGEVHIHTTIECECEPCQVLLPTSRVAAFFKEVDDEIVTMTLNGTRLTLKAGNAVSHLDTVDSAEFPPVPKFSGSAYWRVDAKTFCEAVNDTVFCVDATSTRYALGGVQIVLATDVRFHATDGRRLSLITASAASNEPNMLSEAIVPVDAMKLIAAASTGEFVDIATTDNTIECRVGSTSIVAQSIVGRFPDVDRIVPKPTRNIDIPVKSFQSLVRQARIVQSKESSGIDLAFGKGSLKAEGKSVEVGQSTSEIPIADDGEVMTITLAGEYLDQYLRTLDVDGVVTVGLSDYGSPVLFTAGNYRHIIMPLAVTT